MPTPRAQKIGDILVRSGVLDELQLRSAIAQHENWGGRLAHVVAEMGLANEERIVDTLARALAVQRIRLGNLQRDPGAVSRIDAQFADEKGIFPVQLRDNGKVLLLAMADPTDLETVDEVSRRTRARVQAFIAGEQEIKSAIDRHYRGIESSNASRPATRPASSPAAADEEEEEFKIVDISGKTVMKRLADIDPALAAQEQAPRTAPPVLSASVHAGASASDMLDDILGGGAEPGPQPQLTEEELQRLATVQVNQEKSAKILRAVRELLVEKGYLSR